MDDVEMWRAISAGPYRKVLAVKDKLETLCRELQKANKNEVAAAKARGGLLRTTSGTNIGARLTVSESGRMLIQTRGLGSWWPNRRMSTHQYPRHQYPPPAFVISSIQRGSSRRSQRPSCEASAAEDAGKRDALSLKFEGGIAEISSKLAEHGSEREKQMKENEVGRCRLTPC